MFKKGQFVRNIDNGRIFKVIKIAHDLGNNRIYILRPKGKRNDLDDIDERIEYAHETYEPVKKKKDVVEIIRTIADGFIDSI
jgi:hypothetical protein